MAVVQHNEDAQLEEFTSWQWQRLRAAGVNLAFEKHFGGTPLHVAARLGIIDVVQDILASVEATELSLLHQLFIWLNAKTTSGSTALHLAAGNGHIQVVRQLLNANVEVDPVDSLGKTPLYLAAESGHPQIVDELISLAVGASVDGLQPSVWAAPEAAAHFTPLRPGICQGHLEVVQILLLSGATVETRNAEGHAPLMWAVRQGDQCPAAAAIAQELITKGAKVDATDSAKQRSCGQPGQDMLMLCGRCWQQELTLKVDSSALAAVHLPRPTQHSIQFGHWRSLIYFYLIQIGREMMPQRPPG